MKETTSRHKIITLFKTRDKKENLENGRRKKSHYIERKEAGTSSSPRKTTLVRRRLNAAVKVPKVGRGWGAARQPRILCPKIIFQKTKGECRHFQICEAKILHRQLNHTLKMSKAALQATGKWCQTGT